MSTKFIGLLIIGILSFILFVAGLYILHRYKKEYDYARYGLIVGLIFTAVLAALIFTIVSFAGLLLIILESI